MVNIIQYDNIMKNIRNIEVHPIASTIINILAEQVRLKLLDGLSETDLAKQCKVSQPQINRIKNNKRGSQLPLNTVLLIWEGLGNKMTDLLPFLSNGGAEDMFRYVLQTPNGVIAKQLIEILYNADKLKDTAILPMLKTTIQAGYEQLLYRKDFEKIIANKS